MMTVNDSVYSVPIGNSLGWLKIFSSMVIVTDWSRSLITAKSLRCFTGIFTVLSDLELPNGDGISIINEFDFCGVCYKAFAVGLRMFLYLCVG